MTLLLAVLFVFWALAVQTIPSWHWVVRPALLTLLCLLTWAAHRYGALG